MRSLPVAEERAQSMSPILCRHSMVRNTGIIFGGENERHHHFDGSVSKRVGIGGFEESREFRLPFAGSGQHLRWLDS